MTNKTLERALTHHRQGNLPGAAANYRKVLDQDPRQFTALHMLGVIERDTGNFAAATSLLEQAFTLSPDHAEVQFDLGLTLYRQKDYGDALVYFRRATERDPTMAAAWFQLGRLCRMSSRTAEALTAYQNVETLKPGDPATQIALAVLQCDLGNPQAGVEALTHVLARHPDVADTWHELGRAHWQVGDMQAAKQAFAKADALATESKTPRTSLANLSEEVDPPETVLALYDDLIAAWPDQYMPYTQKAAYLFRQGRYAEGWRAYRWRHLRYGPEGRVFDGMPLTWTGEDISYKRLVIGFDQGLGEQFLFMSMLPDITARATILAVEVDDRIRALAERSFPGLSFVPRTNPPDPALRDNSADYYGSIGDFGEAVRPSLADFPRHSGYLKADGKRVEYWRRQFAEHGGGKRVVGLTAVSHRWSDGPRKSLALDRLGCLTRLDNVVFLNLQYGDARDSLNAWAKKVGLTLLDFPDVDPMVNLDDHAAQIKATTAVVTASNTTAHLAGALGHPAWVLGLEGHLNHWYWAEFNGVNPWYPSIHSLRQKASMDWDILVEKLSHLA